MLAPWKKSYDKPGKHIKKQRHCFANKSPYIQAMVLPVVMHRSESWNIKKAESQRTDAFELWCWRRFLRVPRTVRRSNQSILKVINSEYSLDGLMLELKLQYFGYLFQRVDSGKNSGAGKDWRHFQISFDTSHGYKVVSHCSFDLHFPNDAEQLFMCLLATCKYSLEKCLFKFFFHFELNSILVLEF